jgi:uncharacterized protein (TIGR02145 family)
MCHNLGADETKDPFTPAAEIHGAKYKWGVKTVALTQADDQANPGTITSPTAWAYLPFDNSNNNWLSANNPCPPGWRVPTEEEWGAVINSSYNPTITKVGTDWTNSAGNYTTGMKVGDALFLPAAGLRDYNNGSLVNHGGYGYYWSSTANDSYYGRNLFFSSSSQIISNYSLSSGFSVRCVEE